MDLTEKDVEKLASLARIELSPDEKKRFAGQLSSILDYMKQLNEVDTSQVKVGSHNLPASTLRTDEVEPWPDTKPIIDQWPERAGNLNKVRPVLE
ncbi:MAG: Asp-tRNA(Asn)/Glu-tRNA(Gln) amidotransferase subunit GatC [Patescibacteria group bacterium]